MSHPNSVRRPAAMVAVLLAAGMLVLAAPAVGAPGSRAGIAAQQAPGAGAAPSTTLPPGGTTRTTTVGGSAPSTTTPGLVPAQPPATPGLFDIPGRVRKAIDDWFQGVVAAAVSPALDLLGRTLLATPAVATGPRARELWRLSLGLADGAYVLLVTLAGVVLLAHESLQVHYGVKEIAPRLLVGLAAANLSFWLAGQAIELANAASAALTGQGVDPAYVTATIKTLALAPLAPASPFTALLVGALVVLALLLAGTCIVDVHVAHANDQLGRRVATISIPTTPPATRTCSPGRGARRARRLGRGGHRLLRRRPGPLPCRQRPGRAGGQPARPSSPAPPRQVRPLDAQAAAKAVQAGQVTATPKAGDGQVEMIRSLRVARQTAMRARTQAINALKALLVTAPIELREQLRGLSVTRLVRTAAELEPGPVTSPAAAAMLALRTLAGRHQALSAEIAALTTELDRLTAKAAPQLVALFGVGQDAAGALLVAAGDNPGRLRADAAFSMLCGASPSRRPPARPPVTASTAAATGRPTRRCTGSCWSGCATISRPRTTWRGVSPRASPRRRSPAA